MFAAVRERLVGAWRRVREGSLAKLFVFEFVVVLLGVLAAQWVADLAADRRLGREADAALAEATQRTRLVSDVQAWWTRHADCMIERTRIVAHTASEGGTMTRAEIGRPALPSSSMPSWNEDVRQAALARHGSDVMNALSQVEKGMVAMDGAANNIRDAWSTFALLEASNGAASEADRAAVRLAAVRAADHIRFLRYIYGNAEDERAALGMQDFEATDRWADIVDDCGMIRDWGE